MNKLKNFLTKWGSGGIRRSLERKRLRRQQRKLVQMPDGPLHSSTIDHLLLTRYPACEKLPIYRIPNVAGGRVSIVTDSINAGSLYGGVGTALMLGAMIAKERQTPLRIITRTEPAHAPNLHQILSLAGLSLDHEPQFLFAPPLSATPRVDVLEQELFITTSWWTTAATLGAVPDPQILYLLQEDERMFYPFGDDRLYCERILSNPDIRFAINSKLLHEHFRLEGFENIWKNGKHFEPAFPSGVFRRIDRPSNAKRRFMFYARPNHARNLFYFGLEVVREAVEQGLLDPAEWEIFLVGKDLPRVTFDGAIPAKTKEGMNWHEYADFIGSVDVALSLMYTPHPSYPPLDLAASGAWVVTNQYGNKRSLTAYSERIVTAPLSVPALVQGLRTAIRHAEDPTLCPQNMDALGRDWAVQLSPIVENQRNS